MVRKNPYDYEEYDKERLAYLLRKTCVDIDNEEVCNNCPQRFICWTERIDDGEN